jgi:Domain of unknown function (DUF1995)
MVITITIISEVQPYTISSSSGRLVLYSSKHRRRMVPFQQTDSTSEVESKQQYKIPLAWDEMVRQVASCSKQASAAGVNKQIVRILLPRDSTSGDFGKYLENNVGDDNQGDAAAPTATEIVRIIQQNKNQGIPSRIREDRSVDESGVDGVGFITTDDQSISCWVQPTQENVDDFIKTAQRVKDAEIAMILNPQWRQVDDALDSASQNSANPFLQGLANFLGGKGAVLQRCADVGYTPVYSLEGYVCKGANVRLIQTFQQEWDVYVERDDLESYIPIGTSKTRPTYQSVEEMMTKSDIGYKYARDIGLQPKL